MGDGPIIQPVIHPITIDTMLNNNGLNISDELNFVTCEQTLNTCLRIFTARKRSLQRLCFYTCVSVQRGGLAPGGCLLQRGSDPRGVVWRPPPVTATAAGGMHPTGMHSCTINAITGEKFSKIQSEIYQRKGMVLSTLVIL